MKNITKKKLINVIFFFATVVMALLIYWFVKLGYCVEYCSLNTKVGIINPLHQYFVGLAVISGLFLLLPSRFFKQWLLIVLPIATILIVLHASDVSVNTSGILSMSRSEVVRFDMFVLSVVSLLFVVGVYVREKMMKKKSTNK